MISIISDRITALEPSATEEVDNLVKRMVQGGVRDIISLGVGESDFDTPHNIKVATWCALEKGKTKYEPAAGDYTLRQAICEKFKHENHIDANVDNVIVTVGGKFAIFLAFQVVLSPGEKVLILDPAWVTYEPAAKLAGADVIRLPPRAGAGFQPDIEAINRVMKDSVKMVVVNSPCNPTGTVYDEPSIRRICQIAKAHNAFVLSDEIYEYLIYEGAHFSPGSEFDNVITVNGFSKSYAMTGWRLGYVTAPREIIHAMLKIIQHSTSCVTAFAQAGAIEALLNPESRKAIETMVVSFRERRALMIECIEKSEYMDLGYPPRGAFYCFPAYRLKMPSLELANVLLDQAHVATVPGAAFGQGGEGYLRLCYATDKKSITEAFNRMEDVFRRI